ncbi:MAG: PCMD domain-containing protein [Prevotella sp.]|nr:PCMD domain-containing protein [Prevotella sp.]
MKTSNIGKLAVVLLCGQLLTSCIKDEAPNMECDITSAWVEGAQYEENFYQPTQMRKENISSTTKEIVFTVRSLYSLPNIPVSFTLTPGATIEPANGSEQDFSNGPITYTVTSEDGEWTRPYLVSFEEASLPATNFSFENIEVVYTDTVKKKNSYHNFYEVDSNGKRLNIWASGNPGVALTKVTSTPEDYTTRQVDNGYNGKCVCMSTQDAGSLGRMMKKPIAAGNLFLGNFIVENVLFNALKATEFGININRVPVRVTGYYKYKPGPEFTDKDMKVIDRTDEADIYAVFFRNTDENGKEVKLYGDDVLTSPYIVKKAQVASLPPTDEWTFFEMFFEGDDADLTILSKGGYDMTLVFSSSKNGANFEGAIGSTLYVDEVEMFYEEDEQE